MINNTQSSKRERERERERKKKKKKGERGCVYACVLGNCKMFMSTDLDDVCPCTTFTLHPPM